MVFGEEAAGIKFDGLLFAQEGSAGYLTKSGIGLDRRFPQGLFGDQHAQVLVSNRSAERDQADPTIISVEGYILQHWLVVNP